MSGKVIEMPKSNQQLWDAVFNKMIAQTDERIAEQKAQKFGASSSQERRRDDRTSAAPALEASSGCSDALLASATSGKRRDAPIQSAHQQSQEIVNLDDLGITLGEYEPDYRDLEPMWSDSDTERERQNSIKGR